MVLEKVPPQFWDWLPSATGVWLWYLLWLMLALLVLRFFVLAVREGVDVAGSRLVVWLSSAAQDLLGMSPRRVWAVARMSIIEAVRLRAFVVLGVFGAVLAMALWFLRADTINPGEQYLSAVLWSTNVLVIVTALFISVFSLPADLKNKTIFTVVAKPVRPTELVLGRMIGFIAVGSVILLVMSAISYGFVVRSLAHTHELAEADVRYEEPSPGSSLPPSIDAQTSSERGHRHRVHANPDGTLATDTVQGHWHAVTVEDTPSGKRYAVGPPEGQFHARTAILGALRFRDSKGADKEKGVNVGETWKYRSYIRGGSLEEAIWRFDGVTPERFPLGLRLDLNIQVFRTHKGDLEKGVLGSIVLRNPRTGVSSAPRNFIAKEFQIDRHVIPRSLVDAQGGKLDLFDDLVDEGRIDVALSSLDRDQYFGMARPDVYLLASESSPLVNYFKACAGIWLQMAMVIVFGVMWSTFLNGAVAMLATVGTIVFGFCHDFLRSIVEGTIEGGGSVEAMVRVIQHKGTRAELDDTVGTSVIHGVDYVLRACMNVVSRLAPDFGSLSDAAYVTQGYDVPPNLLAIQFTTALAYAVPAFLLAYLFFKAREVAR